MSQLALTVIDPAQRSHTLQLPADLPASDVIGIITNRLGLASQPGQYTLLNVKTGVTVPPESTLSAAGVAEGDSLRLVAAASASARTKKQSLRLPLPVIVGAVVAVIVIIAVIALLAGGGDDNDNGGASANAGALASAFSGANASAGAFASAAITIDVATQVRHQFDIPSDGGADQLAWTANSAGLLVVKDETLWRYDFNGTDFIPRYRIGNQDDQRLVGRDLAVGPTGARIATVGYDGVAVWDVETGDLQFIITEEQLLMQEPNLSAIRIAALSFSPDGNTLAVPVDHWGDSGSIDAITLWDTSSGDLIERHTLPAGARDAAYHPDGKTIAISLYVGDHMREHVILWDVETQQVTQEVAYEGASEVAFSPDGQTLAVQTNNKVVLLNASTLEEKFELSNESVAFAWSPDGTLIGGGKRYGGVILFDARTGAAITEVQRAGMVDNGHVVAWSPDGRAIAATGSGLIHIAVYTLPQ